MEEKMRDATREVPGFASVRQWRLVVRSSEQERRRTLRQGQSLLLGTGDSMDLQLSDPTVSAQHCQVSAEPGGLRVVDLGSKNGTYVGAGRVSDVLLQGPCSSFAVGRSLVEVREHETLRDTETMGLIGQAPSMIALREKIRAFAPLRKPVLILGDSGTGKDVVARALHAYSGRAGQYVETNVAAYPDSLIDSELFGVERGAFTGAVASRIGLFEEASGGTLFLDEIAELSRAGQAKLLRVVEDGKVRALGMSGHKKVEARLIAATCMNLDKMVEEGTFREDLFHRLALLVIRLPTLRSRISDIAALASHFLSLFADELGQKYLTPAAMDSLKGYDWPGNVRELYAVLYRAAALSPGDELSPSLFQFRSSSKLNKAKVYPEQAAELMALHENISAAARAAGVPRSTFRSMLQRVK